MTVERRQARAGGTTRRGTRLSRHAPFDWADGVLAVETKKGHDLAMLEKLIHVTS
jgi:hypothetical protein